MGSVFCSELLDVAVPAVRLLSIGEEPEKGNQLTIEAHELLAAAEGIRFDGNAEARDLLRGAADVVVTDGFTGNVALKLLEGGIKELLDLLREEIALDGPRQARRPPDPAGCAPAPYPARPRHLRRRLPARAERAGRDRARQLGPPRDRERDRARRPRRRPSRRRATRRALAGKGAAFRSGGRAPGRSLAPGCPGQAVYDRRASTPVTKPNDEVTWQRPRKRSTSASRKS